MESGVLLERKKRKKVTTSGESFFWNASQAIENSMQFHDFCIVYARKQTRSCKCAKCRSPVQKNKNWNENKNNNIKPNVWNINSTFRTIEALQTLNHIRLVGWSDGWFVLCSCALMRNKIWLFTLVVFFFLFFSVFFLFVCGWLVCIGNVRCFVAGLLFLRRIN